MLFAAGFGLGLGSIAGLSVGPYIFERMFTPKVYSKTLSDLADADKMVDVPEQGAAVTSEMRSLLPFTEPWTTSPDYERVSMINRMLAVLWPGITKAVLTEVMKAVRPALEQQVFSKFKFVEDIVLGTQSMKDADTWAAWIKDKDFTVGSVAPRVGGIKSYNTSDDEVILEVPLVWGSTCKFNVGVFLRGGPVRLYVPVEVSNLQFKVETRITIKPLVETMPCVGGVTITLLKAPHVDLSLKLIKGVDLMSLPVIKEGIRFGLEHVLNGMLIYPNSMSFPIMPNFGVPPPPKGALNVKLLRGEALKGADHYVKLEVRKGRTVQSNTVDNNKNPEWNQEFNLVLDDFTEQKLRLVVYEDDLGWNDYPLAEGTLAFSEVVASNLDPATGKYVDELAYPDFIKAPMQEQLVAVKLSKPYEELSLLGAARGVGRLGSAAAKSLKSFGGKGGKPAKPTEGSEGTLYLKVTFLPFLQHTFDDEDEEQAKKKPKKPLPPRPAARVINHAVTDKSKGVLTVNLIRCVNLPGDNPHTYVRLLVTDEDSEHDQSFKSSVVISENSPRWGTKFDFVMVTAGSTLHLTVHQQPSTSSTLLKTVNIFASKKKPEETDKVLGKLAIPVKDVVRNGSLKDIWTLGDAVRGEVELALSWQGVEVPDV